MDGDGSLEGLLSAAGERGENKRLTVDKRRAQAEKTGILDAEAQEILDLLVRLTTPFRRYLKNSGDANYKKLWLVVSGGDSYGDPRWMRSAPLRRSFGMYAKYLKDGMKGNGEELNRTERATAKHSFLNAHPSLSPYVDGATLKTLPVMSGILVWFETGGDATKAARAMGHSKRMTMDAYIPKPIQDLMNERMIRRFQNMLICAATANRNYLLEATDFRTRAELHEFLSQILLVDGDSGSDGVVAEILKDKLSGSVEVECLQSENDNNSVHVSICENSLAALFLYKEHLDKEGNPSMGTRSSKCDAGFWNELATTLHVMLPQSKTNRELTRIYECAIEHMDRIRGKIIFPAI